LLSSTQWQGAIYGGDGTRVLVDSSTRFSGPILADEVDLESSVQAEGFDTITTSPVGMPGNGTAANGQLGTPELFSG
jgi:hypothetical protein